MFESRPTSSTPQVTSKPEASTTRSRDIKCYKCQGFGHISTNCSNKRSMVILDNGEVVSEEDEDDDAMPLLDDVSDDEVAAGAVGASITLVARRALNVHAKEEVDTAQRENIFYTRCQVP